MTYLTSFDELVLIDRRTQNVRFWTVRVQGTFRKSLYYHDCSIPKVLVCDNLA